MNYINDLHLKDFYNVKKITILKYDKTIKIVGILRISV